MLKNIYKVNQLLNLLELDASSLFFFGGTVRDRLLGRESADFDLLFTSDIDLDTLIERVEGIPNLRVILRKDEFCYLKVLYRAGTNIIIDLQTTTNVESFLKKRDFTINSLAVYFKNSLSFFASKNTDLVIDLNNGLKDLKGRILKPCSKNSFKEDPIRIIRACYMLCSFDLRAHPLLLEMVKEDSSLLKKLSPNRLYNEFTKFFFKNPVRFLRAFSSLDLDLILLGKKINHEEIEEVARIETLIKRSKKKERKALKTAILHIAGLHYLWFIGPFLPKRHTKIA